MSKIAGCFALVFSEENFGDNWHRTFTGWMSSDSISKTPFTRYNRLWNRLYNRFDNRLYHVNKHPTGCQTHCQTGLTTVFSEQPLFVQPVVKTGRTTGLTNTVWQPCWTNSHCSFNRLWNRVVQLVWQPAVYRYTIQPVVKRVWQPVWQPVVSCKQGLSNQWNCHATCHTQCWRFWHTSRCLNAF